MESDVDEVAICAVDDEELLQRNITEYFSHWLSCLEAATEGCDFTSLLPLLLLSSIYVIVPSFLLDSLLFFSLSSFLAS